MNRSIPATITFLFLLSLTLGLFLMGCGRTSEDPPTAAFTYTSVWSRHFPATVQFINTSTTSVPSATYIWDFGDGSPVSTQVSPSHTYTQMRVYAVRLIQTPSTGSADTVTMNLDLNLNSGPRPSGSSSRTSAASFTFALPPIMYTATFINASSGANSYLWKFGDGATSTTDSLTVVHSYGPGTFHVNLSATNSHGTDTTGATITFQ